MDTAVPIVFPDYLIAVNTPPAEFQIPDLLPGIDVLPPMVRIPGTNNHVPELGHAGLFFFNGRGATKYYEYGRYDHAALGVTRRTPLPDLAMGEGKRPMHNSLRQVLSRISARAGQNGRLMAAYIELEAGGFESLLRYCQARVAANGNASREPYSLLSN